MNRPEENEEHNSELVQNTRVMKFDLDKRLVSLLITELDRVQSQAGHEVMSLSDAINDALATYIANLRAHNFSKLN